MLAADLLAWTRPSRSRPPPPHADGSRNESASDCWQWRGGSSPATADTDSDYPPTGHGPTSSSTAGTDSTPPDPGTKPPPTQGPEDNRRAQRRQSATPGHPHTTQLPARTATKIIKPSDETSRLGRV